MVMPMKIVLALALAAVLLLAGCSQNNLPPLPFGKNNTTSTNGSIGIANPASKFCVEKGFKSEIRTAQDGSQKGYCIFPGGKECEEWAFYRGQCTDASYFSMETRASAPMTTIYEFYPGRLEMTEKYANRTSRKFSARLPQEAFPSFAKLLEDSGFEGFDASYGVCHGEEPCIVDAPSYLLKFARHGKVKEVGIYYQTTARPQAVEDILAAFHKMTSGVNFTESMTEQLCKSAGGSWNNCISPCRGAPDGTACIAICWSGCECGGFAGFRCPAGFECTDYLPSADNPDAMGICKRAQ
jgi:putative hemolysin